VLRLHPALDPRSLRPQTPGTLHGDSFGRIDSIHHNHPEAISGTATVLELRQKASTHHPLWVVVVVYRIGLPIVVGAGPKHMGRAGGPHPIRLDIAYRRLHMSRARARVRARACACTRAR